MIKVEFYNSCNNQAHCTSQLFTLPAAENRQKNNYSVPMYEGMYRLGWLLYKLYKVWKLLRRSQEDVYKK